MSQLTLAERTSSLSPTPVSLSVPRADKCLGKGKDRKGTRNGIQHYCAENIEALLDVVQELEPLGSNIEKLVSKNYNKDAELHDLTERDAEALKKKFGKLTATQEKTGNFTCSKAVRQAKRVARAMLVGANAVVLGGNGEHSDCNGSLDQSTRKGYDDIRGSEYEKKRKRSRAIVVRKRRTVLATAGVKGLEYEEECIAVFFCEMS